MNIYKTLLTPEQQRINMNNRNRLWRNICGNSKGIPGMVAHHKDQTLIYRDPDRYIQWNPIDIELMSKADHIRLHRIGKRHSQESKEQMSRAHMNRPFTEEHKRRLSESHKLYWINKKRKELIDGAKEKLADFIKR